MAAEDRTSKDGWEPVELASAKEYTNKRRIETIQDAYERVIMRRNDAQDHESPVKEKIYFEAVKDYLFATQELFFKEEAGPEFWYGGEDEPIHIIKPPQAPESQAIVIDGLQDYLFASPPWEFVWYDESENRLSGKQEIERSAVMPMPEEVSTKVYFWTNYFVQNIANLGLDMSDADEEARGKYSDLKKLGE